ncbi:MAG: hypothetical protein EZS28_055192, partial [Streblomastix strix]
IQSLVASQGGTVGYQFGEGRDDMNVGGGMGTGAVIDQNDPENTTIFVGNIESDVTEVEIRREFNKFGSIPFVKIPPSHNCAFIQYMKRSEAERALMEGQGNIVSMKIIMD